MRQLLPSCDLGGLLRWRCNSLLQGTLRGFDQTVNVILENCVERVYEEDGVDQVPLGLYIVRGDNLYVNPLHSRRKL